MPLLQQPPIIPVTGASSVAQLEELSGAAALRLDGAGERLAAAGARSTPAGPTR